MKTKSFDKEEIRKKASHAIDEYHQMFKDETWENSKQLDLLIDLDRISELK